MKLQPHKNHHFKAVSSKGYRGLGFTVTYLCIITGFSYYHETTKGAM